MMLAIRKANYLNRHLSSQFFFRGCSSKNNSEDDKIQEKTGSDAKKIEQNELKVSEQPEETAAEKLNRLLASMKTEENLAVSLEAKSMAKPKERKKKTVTETTTEKKSSDTKENLIKAAKKVALLYGETGKKQIESELLTKLLNLGDKTHKTQTKNEDLSLSELITGMQIDRRQQPKTQSRGDFVRKSFGGRSPPHHRPNPFADDGDMTPEKTGHQSYIGSVNLFGGKPLGIFNKQSNLKDSPDMLKTWEHLSKRDLQLEVAHPPRNYFEKMIQWTEQGKLWKFPIDNEQGMDEEAKVDFTEHVFLEQHLEDWCPTRGPIRHYMELVCVGLSKNPYITAKEKKDHILWYRDYFNQKKDILQDLMDQEKMQIATSSTTKNQQSITES